MLWQQMSQHDILNPPQTDKVNSCLSRRFRQNALQSPCSHSCVLHAKQHFQAAAICTALSCPSVQYKFTNTTVKMKSSSVYNILSKECV